MTFTRILLALSLVCLPIGAQVSPTINPLPSRAFGQTKMTLGLQTQTPNLLEGNELSGPTAIAFDTTSATPVVYVADTANHRVLAWKNPGSLTRGNPADRVIGQRDFFSAYPGGPGTAPPALVSSGMVFPNGLAVDSNGNLYVMDAGNNRILRFPRPMEQQGELVNPDMVIGQKTPGATATLGSAGPIGIALDAFDNIIAAEAANRMTFYYARAIYQHAATYASGSLLGSTLTPNMYTILYRLGKGFDFTPASAVPPCPKTLAGLEVLVNGTPAPITSVLANAIYFLVPNNAPTAGDVEYLVRRPATGEIIAAGNFTMGTAAPGFFTANQQGTQQIAATNEDGTPNSASNRIGQDQLLTLWMTGFGRLDNAPPDGEAAGRAVPTDVNPVITIGAYRVPPEKILYSGLSPEFPGLWQINIRMPKNGEPFAPLPGPKVPILVQMRDVPSNIGGTANPGVDRQLTVPNDLITTVALK